MDASNTVNVKDLTREAEKGNGCVVADGLNLLSLTDRVNAIAAMKKQNDVNQAESYNTNSLSVERGAKGAAHLRISTSTRGQWGSTSIYHEDYLIGSNSSSVECTNLHLDQPGSSRESKTFTKNY